MHLIRKDVDRTLQETEFFRDPYVRDQMCELLYVWARENPEYQYQQGMNDILSILMVVLASEFGRSDGGSHQTQKLFS